MSTERARLSDPSGTPGTVTVAMDMSNHLPAPSLPRRSNSIAALETTTGLLFGHHSHSHSHLHLQQPSPTQTSVTVPPILEPSLHHLASSASALNSSQFPLWHHPLRETSTAIFPDLDSAWYPSSSASLGNIFSDTSIPSASSAGSGNSTQQQQQQQQHPSPPQQRHNQPLHRHRQSSHSALSHDDDDDHPFHLPGSSFPLSSSLQVALEEEEDTGRLSSPFEDLDAANRGGVMADVKPCRHNDSAPANSIATDLLSVAPAKTAGVQPSSAHLHGSRRNSSTATAAAAKHQHQPHHDALDSTSASTSRKRPSIAPLVLPDPSAVHASAPQPVSPADQLALRLARLILELNAMETPVMVQGSYPEFPPFDDGPASVRKSSIASSSISTSTTGTNMSLDTNHQEDGEDHLDRMHGSSSRKSSVCSNATTNSNATSASSKDSGLCNDNIRFVYNAPPAQAISLLAAHIVIPTSASHPGMQPPNLLESDLQAFHSHHHGSSEATPASMFRGAHQNIMMSGKMEPARQSLSAWATRIMTAKPSRSVGTPTNVNLPEDLKDMDGMSATDKLALKRLRNRVSASRCRIKKKMFQDKVIRVEVGLHKLALDADMYVGQLEMERDRMARKIMGSQ